MRVELARHRTIHHESFEKVPVSADGVVVAAGQFFEFDTRGSQSHRFLQVGICKLHGLIEMFDRRPSAAIERNRVKGEVREIGVFGFSKKVNGHGHNLLIAVSRSIVRND